MLTDPTAEAIAKQNNDPHFPRMLFRFPGAGADAIALQDGKYAAPIVDDQAALDRLLADGYSLTPTEARAVAAQKVVDAATAAAAVAHEKALADAKALLAEHTAPPTREELELKATELGVKFDGRTPDKKLGEQIAAALRH